MLPRSHEVGVAIDGRIAATVAVTPVSPSIAPLFRYLSGDKPTKVAWPKLSHDPAGRNVRRSRERVLFVSVVDTTAGVCGGNGRVTGVMSRKFRNGVIRQPSPWHELRPGVGGRDYSDEITAGQPGAFRPPAEW